MDPMDSDSGNDSPSSGKSSKGLHYSEVAKFVPWAFPVFFGCIVVGVTLIFAPTFWSSPREYVFWLNLLGVFFFLFGLVSMIAAARLARVRKQNADPLARRFPFMRS